MIHAYDIDCIFYADDSQVYIAVNPDNTGDALVSLKKCVKDIFLWNTKNMLKSNPEKTEVLHFSSHSSYLQKLELTLKRNLET